MKTEISRSQVESEICALKKKLYKIVGALICAGFIDLAIFVDTLANKDCIDVHTLMMLILFSMQVASFSTASLYIYKEVLTNQDKLYDYEDESDEITTE
ncbi:MAG: hypothetical protein WCW14_04475 [Candidatus Paceibacterota bacterium]|jgi:hypothetical protein